MMLDFLSHSFSKTTFTQYGFLLLTIIFAFNTEASSTVLLENNLKLSYVSGASIDLVFQYPTHSNFVFLVLSASSENVLTLIDCEEVTQQNGLCDFYINHIANQAVGSYIWRISDKTSGVAALTGVFVVSSENSFVNSDDASNNMAIVQGFAAAAEHINLENFEVILSQGLWSDDNVTGNDIVTTVSTFTTLSIVLRPRSDDDDSDINDSVTFMGIVTSDTIQTIVGAVFDAVTKEHTFMVTQVPDGDFAVSIGSVMLNLYGTNIVGAIHPEAWKFSFDISGVIGEVGQAISFMGAAFDVNGAPVAAAVNTSESVTFSITSEGSNDGSNVAGLTKVTAILGNLFAFEMYQEKSGEQVLTIQAEAGPALVVSAILQPSEGIVSNTIVGGEGYLVGGESHQELLVTCRMHDEFFNELDSANTDSFVVTVDGSDASSTTYSTTWVSPSSSSTQQNTLSTFVSGYHGVFITVPNTVSYTCSITHMPSEIFVATSETLFITSSSINNSNGDGDEETAPLLWTCAVFGFVFFVGMSYKFYKRHTFMDQRIIVTKTQSKTGELILQDGSELNRPEFVSINGAVLTYRGHAATPISNDSMASRTVSPTMHVHNMNAERTRSISSAMAFEAIASSLSDPAVLLFGSDNSSQAMQRLPAPMEYSTDFESTMESV